MNWSIVLVAWIALGVPVQTEEPFTRFLYCHEFTRGIYESQCVELNADGSGALRYKPRSAEEVRNDLTLSPRALERFVSILARTRFLADGANYESKKKVADLGMKRLAVDTPEGHREASFNFSDSKDAQNLAAFLDDLISQELAVLTLEASLKYQRLAISENLQYIDDEFQSNRIVDYERMAAVMEKIQNDTRVLESAREKARRLRIQMLSKK
ncbi:MAG TPA: hypothetical protein VFY29_06815 [Terriglobia bacterium]|nr:hypothetical protein [Terriglobia bacterium]